jgi:hypothetical protein
VGGLKLMKEIKTQTEPDDIFLNFYLRLNANEIDIIKDALFTLQFNYLNLLEDTADLYKYKKVYKKFHKVNYLISQFKNVNNEAKN